MIILEGMGLIMCVVLLFGAIRCVIWVLDTYETFKRRLDTLWEKYEQEELKR